MRTTFSLIAAMMLALFAAPVAAQEQNASAEDRYAAAREAVNAQDYATAFPLLNGLCQEGYPEPCRIGAMLLAQGAGVERNALLAMTVLTDLCGRGMAAACADVDQLFTADMIPEPDRAGIAQDLISKCDAGQNAAACRYAGKVHADGWGTSADLNAALAAYTSACELGLAAACTDMGGLYASRFPVAAAEGPIRDFAIAASHYAKGCDMGDGVGCAFLADATRAGRGVEADPALALSLYRKAAAMELPRWARNSVEGEIERLSREVEPQQ